MVKKVVIGKLHKMPNDFKGALGANKAAALTWEGITPLAKNEWICWITSGKKDETRVKRLKWGVESLAAGKRRPCCWAGCQHR